MQTYVHTNMHTYMSIQTRACLALYTYWYTFIDVSHRGVFRTKKSFVCALGAGSSMTEPTINSTLLTFIEQVNICDLQKMVLQFAIPFVPPLGYTYMVYTLHN